MRRTRRAENHKASGLVGQPGAGELSARLSRCPRPSRWTRSGHGVSLLISSSEAGAEAGDQQPHISPPFLFLFLIGLSGLKATNFFSQKYNVIVVAETTKFMYYSSGELDRLDHPDFSFCQQPFPVIFFLK